MRVIYCIQCQKDVEAKMIKGIKAYPFHHHLHDKNFWQCEVCKNFVGTHHRGMGNAPLGCIPNKEMKKARQHIHAVIDPIWKSGKATRKQVYEKISDEIGYEYHTGYIRTMEEARNIYSIAVKLRNSL